MTTKLKKATKTAEIAKLIKKTIPSAGKFVIAALGHGFLTGTKEKAWSTDRAEAMEFDTREQADTSLLARRTSAGFPDHAAVSPGPNGTDAKDPGAAAALAKLFPRLCEVDVKDSPYKLLEPKPGVKASDLTVAERAAMAERLNLVGKKLPKYAPKNADGMAAQVAAAKASAPPPQVSAKRGKMIPPSMAEKMEKIGNGAAEIMQKAEAQRKKEAKKPKAGSDGKKPKKAAGAPAQKGRGIGAFCEGLLVKGKSAEEILAAVRKEFPGAKTSMASIAWYRNKLVQEGALSK